MKLFLSVIIPTKNHSRTLPLSLIDIDHHLSRTDMLYEIILVDDASEDQSLEIANRFFPLIKNLKIISSKVPRGMGATVRDGLLVARGAWRVVILPDHHVAIDEFHKVFPYLRSGYDVALGSRAMLRSRVKPQLQIHQILFRMLHNLFVQAVALPGVWDTEAGFIALRDDVAEAVVPLTKINSSGGIVELVALAKKMGYAIKEFPIFWANNDRTKFDYRHYIGVLVDAIKLRWMLVSDEYKINAKL